MKKILMLLVGVFIFSACGFADEDVFGPLAEGKIKIVTTVGMVADMVENVGGDFVYVESLMGPGVDPHLYKASAGDISRMEQADQIFYVGLHLEGKMVEVLESFEDQNRAKSLSKDLDVERLLAPQVGQTGSADPHIWFDVQLWSETLPVVVKTLGELDPENSEIYQKNGQDYLRKLQNLDSWVDLEMKKIPEDQRIMITAHDAFNYFGRAYDVDVRGIQGISTAADYGLKDLEGLIDLIVERKLKAVFVETSVSEKSIKALQQGVKSRGWDVKIGGSLFSDAMGDEGTKEGSYIGMVEYNVNTLVSALK